MVKKSSLKTIQKFIQHLESSFGLINFAVALPNIQNDAYTSLTLFLASPWIENKKRIDALTIILKEMREFIGNDAAELISRITLVSMSDPFVSSYELMHVDGDNIISLNECKLFNLMIEEVYIFKNIPPSQNINDILTAPLHHVSIPISTTEYNVPVNVK